MKRIRTWRSFEILEQKRLKAADLVECPDAHGPAFVEAAEAAPTSSSTEDRGNIELPRTVLANASADESEDESDDDQDDESENESDDSDENETDETEDDDSDDDSEEGDDESEEDESEEEESDEDDTDEENEEDESESGEEEDEEEDEEDESDDDEDESDEETDDDESDEDDSDEVDDDDDDDDDESENPELSAPITLSAETSGDAQVAAPAQCESVSAALSQAPAEIVDTGLTLTTRFQSRFSAHTVPTIGSNSSTAADPNLLDVVYSTETTNDAGDETALVECDFTEQSEATDAAFASIVSNPLAWAV